MTEEQLKEVIERIELIVKYTKIRGKEYEEKGQTFQFMVEHSETYASGLEAALEVIEKVRNKG